MEDFIIFSNTCSGRTLVRKSVIVNVYEDNADGDVTVGLADGSGFETSESFDYIISKLTK